MSVLILLLGLAVGLWLRTAVQLACARREARIWTIERDFALKGQAAFVRIAEDWRTAFREAERTAQTWKAVACAWQAVADGTEAESDCDPDEQVLEQWLKDAATKAGTPQLWDPTHLETRN